VAKNIQGVCKSLDKAMASMDLQKVEQIMGQFEKQFEDLDVRTAVSIHMVVTVGDIFVRIIMLFTLCKSSGTTL
jgi:division protein CdvB (Snf7/Vps24/ESCRT-III family)